VCLGCRTLLADGETCGAKRGHDAVALGVPAQRARLDDEVWGPDSRARKLRQAAKAGASGGLFGGAMQGCGALDGLQLLEGCGDLAGAGEGIFAVLAALVAIVVAAIVTAVFAGIVLGIVSLIRQRLDRPKPHGALRKPPKASGRFNGAGTVSGSAQMALPWKEGESLAYAFELHTKSAFGGGALLRDAMSAGFDVTLDDGRRVRVPPGRVTVLGTLPEAKLDNDRVDQFLGDVDPRRGARSVFPYDYGRGLELHAGDRVDVLGDLETGADGSEGNGYRASAGLLVPVGVPVLRVRRRADDDAHYRIAGGDGGAGAAGGSPDSAQEEAQDDEEQVNRGEA
jgi:hypothetical protein